MSPEFKDLILRMFSYEGNKRPTIAEIKAHPWLQKPYSVKMTRQSVMDKIVEKRAEKTVAASNANESRSRGDLMNELIRETTGSDLELYKFNDMVDFDIDVSPGFFWEELQMFNIDLFEEKLKLDINMEKKYITI